MKTNLYYEDEVNGKGLFFNPKKGKYVAVGRNKANRPQRGGKQNYC